MAARERICLGKRMSHFMPLDCMKGTGNVNNYLFFCQCIEVGELWSRNKNKKHTDAYH